LQEFYSETSVYKSSYNTMTLCRTCESSDGLLRIAPEYCQWHHGQRTCTHRTNLT